MEVEAKFELTARGIFGRLERAKQLAGFDLGEKHATRVVDTFLDTKRRRLYRAGYYLRLRPHGPEQTLVTLKQYAGDGQAIYRREEHELLLPGPTSEPRQVDVSSWPESPARDIVEQLTKGGRLSPLFSLRQRRSVRPLLRDGQTIAELSLDDVELRRDDAKTRFLAIEVELKPEGDETALAAVVACLLEEPGVTASPLSKFERALALIDTETSRTDGSALLLNDGTSIGLDDSMVEAARKTLLRQFREMLKHEAGTREGQDEEELHDMRVATRRMRAALKAFDPYLSNNPFRSFRKPLRRLGRALGDVRDLDVFHASIRAYLAGLPEDRRSELEPLLAVWQITGDRRRRAMLAHLDGEEYAHFKQVFGKLLEQPRSERVASKPRANRTRQLLPGMLYKHYVDVWAFDGWVNRPGVPLARYHELRIASKGLRYALEFFREVLPAESAPLINRTKQLQDHLGEMQDAVVACGVLRDFLASGTWGNVAAGHHGPAELVIAPGVAAYLANRQARLGELIQMFPPVWATISGVEFRQCLGSVAAALIAGWSRQVPALDLSDGSRGQRPTAGKQAEPKPE